MSLSSFGMDPATKETLSQILGYGSIGLWLFAQTPQLITNYRRKNCEGLALPFLANWLAGDVLNMIGCFLTDQLEFQKYLALYFCLVDIGLVSQFWCYYKPTPKPHHHHSKRSLISSTSSSPRLLSTSSPHLSNLPTSSSSPSGPNGGSASGGPSRPGNRRRHTRIPGSFEEMSAAAANVARAAEAVAASKRGGSSTNKSSRSRSRKRKSSTPRGNSSGRAGGEERLEDSVTTLGGDSIRSDVSNSRGNILESAWEPQSHQRTSNSSSRHNLTSSSASASPATSPSQHRAPSLSSHPTHGLTPSHSATSLTASSQSSATASPILVQRPTHPINEDGRTPTASERGRTLTRPPPPPAVTFGVQPPTPDHQSTLVESMQHQQQQQGLLKNPPLLKRSGSRSLSVQRGGGAGGGGSGRSTAGVVLMSLVGMVGVGSLSSVGGRGIVGRSGNGGLVGGGLAGRILWSGQSSSVSSSPSLQEDSSIPSASLLEPLSPSPILLSELLLPLSSEPGLVLEPATFVDPTPSDSSLDSSSRRHPEDPGQRPKKPPHGVPTGPEVTWQRLIGRISAWTCTVLYLTSRMPQIWKNFTRKSTEGLSVFLFLFAFLANSLYVSSILLNPLIDQPRPESTNYILESLPYVLGSGGTLLFDSTIMIQFFIYGSSKPLPEDDTTQPWLNKRTASSRHRSSRLYHDSTNDLMDDGDLESAPLLSGVEAGSGGGGTIRPRTRSASAGGGRSPLYFTSSRSRSRQREDVLGLRGIIAAGSGLGSGLGDVEGLPYSPEGSAAATGAGGGVVGSRSRERTSSSTYTPATGENLRESVIMESSNEDGVGSGSGNGDRRGSSVGRLIDSS